MAAQPGRPLELRLMGAALVVLWVALAVAIAADYRPGGPLDAVVVGACFMPAIVAAMSVVWPARPGGDRDRVALVWLWIAAVLLAVPLLHAVASRLLAGGAQSLIPSAEAAYAGFLALLSMCAFSLVGVVHARRAAPVFQRSATIRAALLTLAVTFGIAAAFGGVFLINDGAFRAGAPVESSYGPTDPALLLPDCDEPAALGPYASVTVEARASVDDRPLGEAHLVGERSGSDEVWSGSWTSVPGSGLTATGRSGAGELAYRRVDSEAWLNLGGDADAPGTTWQSVAPDPFDLAGPEGLTMDGPTQDLVGGEHGAIVTEDLGLELIEGARARHCRTFIDGPTALATFLPLRWLIGGDPMAVPTRLAAWRGKLDWWVFADGQLGRAFISVSGLSSDAWSSPPGIRGTLEAGLAAVNRSEPTDVTAPPGT